MVGRDKPAADVTVENHGTIFRFVLHTDTARAWVEANVDLPDYMTDRNTFYAEHRCAAPVALGMRMAGLRIL